MSRYNYCIVTEAKGGAGWAGAGRPERARSAQASVRGGRRACVGAGRHAGNTLTRGAQAAGSRRG